MSKQVNVDFVTRQVEVDTDGKEHFISAAMAAKDANAAAVNAQNAAKEVKEIYGDGNFTPLSDLLGGLGTKLKRWGSIFANKVFASNLPIVYNNVAEMKADTMLWEGMSTKTLGYYTPNDGGGASYLIRAKTDDYVDDGGSLLELDNGLVAELIVENDTVYPEQFGAKGDGMTDDSSAIQNAVDSGKPVFFARKVYCVKNPIVLGDSVHIHGNQDEHTTLTDAVLPGDAPNPSRLAGYIKAIAEVNCVFEVKGHFIYISDLAVECDGKAAYGIYSDRSVNYSRNTFKNVFVHGAKENGFEMCCYLSLFERCIASSCKIGFRLGSSLNAGMTSLTMVNCYSKQCLQYGYYLNSYHYSNFISLCCDQTPIAYCFDTVAACAMSACGAEEIDTVIYLDNSITGFTIDGLWIIPNSGCNIVRFNAFGDVSISNVKMGNGYADFGSYLKNEASTDTRRLTIYIDKTINKFGYITNGVSTCNVIEDRINLITEIGYTEYSENVDTIIYDRKANGIYKISNGATTSRYIAEMGTVTLPAGTYYATAFESHENNILSFSLGLYISKGSYTNNNIVKIDNYGKTFTLEAETTVHFGVVINSNISFSDFLVKPSIVKIG